MKLATARQNAFAAKRAAKLEPSRKSILAQIGEEGWDDYCNGDAFTTVYIGEELEAYVAGWNSAKNAQGDKA